MTYLITRKVGPNFIKEDGELYTCFISDSFKGL